MTDEVEQMPKKKGKGFKEELRAKKQKHKASRRKQISQQQEAWYLMTNVLSTSTLKQLDEQISVKNFGTRFTVVRYWEGFTLSKSSWKRRRRQLQRCLCMLAYQGLRRS